MPQKLSWKRSLTNTGRRASLAYRQSPSWLECASILYVNLCINDSGCDSLQVIRDETREKPLELEMGWVCEASNWQYSLVSKDLVKAADIAALAAVAGQTIQPVPDGIEATFMRLAFNYEIEAFSALQNCINIIYLSVAGAVEEKSMDVAI